MTRQFCSIAAAIVLAATTTLTAQRAPYPISPGDLCTSTQTCEDVLNEWNDRSWEDLVDDGFQTGSTPMAAVRWYSSEANTSLHTCSTVGSPDPATHEFCGVTDEFSNVLLSFAMGSNQTRYEKLRNFSERLRRSEINGLQCWKYGIPGSGNYDSTSPCVAVDSASDASIRILGAYGIACAKQSAGIWDDATTDYCTDYVTQGNAIFGINTSSHGEVKILSNGEYYLANGYNNQVGAPTAYQSFRPDYYELQFLMDFAEYQNDSALIGGVQDMLEHYYRSIGGNAIHEGKTGHFASDGTGYVCDEICSPAYMDNIDTWRAIPALSGLLNVHPERVPASIKQGLFDVWWNDYAGGHATLYGPADTKPFEIYSDQTPAVKQTEHSYKTLAMWMPLGAAYDDVDYLEDALAQLSVNKYDSTGGYFYGASYYGGYFSQFAQRAIGAATGMIDPAFWAQSNLVTNGGFEDGTSSWWVSSGNGASASISTTSGANGNALLIDTAAGGSYPWDISVGQNALALTAGTDYRLTFTAEADASRTLGLRVVQTSGTWPEYLAQTVNLNGSMQQFTFDFTTPSAGQTTVNLEFRAGGQGAVDVRIDDVWLIEQD